MHNIIIKITLLITIFLFSCANYDEWHPSEKEKNALLESLLKISKEDTYPNSEFYDTHLWWDHPEVAILQFKAISYKDSSLFSPKRDTLLLNTISVFVHSKKGWEFKRSFGNVQKK